MRMFYIRHVLNKGMFYKHLWEPLKQICGGVCVSVCVGMSLCVCESVCISLCVCVRLCMRLCVCMSVRVRVRLCVDNGEQQCHEASHKLRPGRTRDTRRWPSPLDTGAAATAKQTNAGLTAKRSEDSLSGHSK